MKKIARGLVFVATLVFAAGPLQAADSDTPTPPTPDTPPAAATNPPASTADVTPAAATGDTSGDAEATPDDTMTSSKCSVATINGNYGGQLQGFRVQGRKLIPYNAVRTAVFDGQGKATGQGMANLNGRIVPYTVDASYTVNDDCSVTIEGTQTFGSNGKAEPYKQFGVLVDGGDAIIVMQMTGARSQFGRYEKF